MRRVVLVPFALLLAQGCAIDDERPLPGRPCEREADCGEGFACVQVPGEDGAVCVPKGGDVVVQGCAPGAPDGATCSDGDPCTRDDACRSGVCVGEPLSCGAGEQCVGGLCVEPVCEAGLADVRLTDDPATSGEPRLAYNPARDELAVVFHDDRSGLSSDLFFTSLGVTASAPSSARQLTESGRTDATLGLNIDAFSPHIVYAAGEYGLAWQEVLGVGLFGNIYFARLSEQGALLSAPERLDGLDLLATSPDVGWNGGEFAVVYVNLGDDQTPSELVFVRVSPEGDRISRSTLAVAGEPAFPALASSSDGRTWGVAYRTPGGIFLQLLSDVGQRLSEVRVSAPSAGLSSPSVAVVPGGFAVVYASLASEGGAAQVRFVRVDASGATPVASSEITLSAPGDDARFARVAALEGGLAVAYTRELPQGSEIVVVRSDSQGHSVGAPRVLNANPAGAELPAIAGGASVVGVAWEDTRDGNAEIYARSACP